MIETHEQSEVWSRHDVELYMGKKISIRPRYKTSYCSRYMHHVIKDIAKRHASARLSHFLTGLDAM
jgi:hypothetical protein